MENPNNTVWLRRAELALGILMLGFGVLALTGSLFSVGVDNQLLADGLILVVFLFLPLALAVVSLLSAVSAESTVRSYLTGTVVTVVLLGVLGAWALFFFAGGGVQVGHLLSFALGVVLAVVVLLKQTTLRLRPHLDALGQ